MKTKLFTLLLLLSAAIASAETMRVAILEPVDRENKVNYGIKLMLRSNLAKAVTNTTGYEAFDRSDIDAIMGEQNFQRTGMVSEDQIKRLGEMTGAKYILVAEAAMIDAKNMFITAKVLDVETAKTIMIDNLMMETDAKKIQEGCAMLAGKLFHVQEKAQYSTTTFTQSNKVILEPISSNRYVYGGVEMTRKEMEKLLYNNCNAAFNHYSKSKTLQKAGWGMMGIGLGLGIIGGGILGGFVHYVDNNDYGDDHNTSMDKRFNLLSSGFSFVGIGCSFVAFVSIPLIGVGYSRSKKSIDMFNQQCATPKKLTLNLQASQNGLGLALNF